MSRELLVLRHGRAESGGGLRDMERELSDPGKRDIQRVGVKLQAEGWLPDATVASPATRAAITAEEALKAGGRGTAELRVDDRIYDASTGELLDVIETYDSAPQRVLLVGHNPGLSDLVSFLAGTRARLSPGMLVRLTMPDGWLDLRPASAEIADTIDPASLPELFPFPAPGSTDMRPRPAYYYIQSGVIPFRRTGNGLEILIIGSSKNKKWVVPKGIATPGLTPQDSAAKEAREEAGVEGTVGDPALGNYTYKKWDAQVTCVVYPMEVTTIHPEHAWEESHRGRKWVTPDEARALLERPELRDLVTALLDRVG